MRNEPQYSKAIDARDDRHAGIAAGIALAIITVVNGMGGKLSAKFGSISSSLK
jgi:hypothetical protein